MICCAQVVDKQQSSNMCAKAVSKAHKNAVLVKVEFSRISIAARDGDGSSARDDDGFLCAMDSWQ
eukprot:2855537-Prymnesium_polylepis.1